MAKHYGSLCMITAVAALLIASPSAQAQQDVPVAIDSRIRTLVYSPNEVFRMYTEHGYQSNIEFAPDEQITTISLGSPSAFKITPSGNRLFVKALQKGRHTNMTVLTTKRSYQFELFSDMEDREESSVIYVMRFYYPEDNFDDVAPQTTPQADTAASSVTASPVAAPASAPIAPEAVAQQSVPPEPEAMPEVENYNYSLTGTDAISPTRVFDNGSVTFFKFPPGSTPTVFGVRPDGTEYAVPARIDGEYVAVDAVLDRFSLRMGSDVVCVFNESFNAAPGGQPPFPAMR